MITLFNGECYGTEEIISLAYNDDFYYGHLGKNALSSSMLRNIFNSPNTQLQYLKKQGRDGEPLIIGKLTHWCFLEPKVFYSKHYVNADRIDAKIYKEAVAKFGEENVFKEKHRNIAEWLCEKLHNNETIMDLRKRAEIEQPMVRMLDDLAVRGKADMIVDDVIYDLKTGIIPPEEFARWDVNKKNYDLQAYMYLRLFKNTNKFKFIYINKKTRDIGIINVPENVIERGEIKFKMAVEAYRKIFHLREIDEIQYSLDQYIYEDEAR